MIIDYKAKDLEIEAKRLSKASESGTDGGFEEGLQAVVVDSIVSEEEQQKEAGIIIENAKKEAADILDKAKQEAIMIKEEAYKKAEKEGYEEGLRKGNLEADKIKKELNELKIRQNKEYMDLLGQIEPRVADLIISLITKLTGILVEDKKDIILYLVEKSLRDYDNLDSYNIRVSKADYDLILSKKEYLEEITGNSIQISVDSKLDKNQCLIDTESKVIDCSLDVQLNNLVNDIKLLSSI